MATSAAEPQPAVKRNVSDREVTVPPWLSPRWCAIAIAVAAPMVLAAGIVIYRTKMNAPGILDLEFAGSVSRIHQVVGNYPGRYTNLMWVDFAYIALYGAAIVIGSVLGRYLAFTKAGRLAATGAMFAAVAAVLCNVAENIAVLLVLHHVGGDTTAGVAATLAFTKFALVIPAGTVAGIFVVVTLWRAAGRPLVARTMGWDEAQWTREAQAINHTEDAVAAAVEDDGDDAKERRDKLSAARKAVSARNFSWPAKDVDLDLIGPRKAANARAAQRTAESKAAWRLNSQLPPLRSNSAGSVGFCVSGGGIRSATFALGALDALRDELCRARYLVSVSGGGYAAGALQLALQPVMNAGDEAEDCENAARPDDVLRSGSPELDHNRRHGRYLAGSPLEWAEAIVRMLRGLVVNLLILALAVTVVGRLLGQLYAAFPDDLLRTSTWPPPAPVSWSIGSLVVMSLGAWMLRVLLEPYSARARQAFSLLTTAAAAVAALCAVLGVVLPLLAWAARTPPHPVVAVSVPATSFIGGSLALLISLLGRPSAVAKEVDSAAKWWSKAGRRQRALVQRAAVYVGLLVIIGGLLALFARVLATTGATYATSTWPGHLTEWKLTLIGALGLTFFGVVDQVRWSLHPFYRRRLATAYSVRREREGGTVTAVPYEYDVETTSLAAHPPESMHGYGEQVEGFPQVIFSCAAHVSAPNVTPPGRRVVPWTMSGDYIGSPVIGWASTGTVIGLTGPILRKDLTVQAAQAISGAAIASQMGRMNAAYTKFLALTNVRLGSWLPNPSYVQRLLDEGATQWWLPRMPSRRYLVTLARELFGVFPMDGPLVYVTDGGHYENLGLVELLRHRCEQIYCLDASGDHGGFAGTLAEAITLAFEELGVTVTVDDPAELATEISAATPNALYTTLADRLADRCVTTATIHYPDLGPGLPAKRGSIIIGKALLTRGTPFEVLAYAAGDAAFPNDSTADQWYDHARYDAYHALGRYVGSQVKRSAATAPRLPDQRDSTENSPAQSTKHHEARTAR